MARDHGTTGDRLLAMTWEQVTTALGEDRSGEATRVCAHCATPNDAGRDLCRQCLRELTKPWDCTKTYHQNLDEGRHWDRSAETAIPGSLVQQWHDELEALSREIGKRLDDIKYGPRRGETSQAPYSTLEPESEITPDAIKPVRDTAEATLVDGHPKPCVRRDGGSILVEVVRKNGDRSGVYMSDGQASEIRDGLVALLGPCRESPKPYAPTVEMTVRLVNEMYAEIAALRKVANVAESVCQAEGTTNAMLWIQQLRDALYDVDRLANARAVLCPCGAFAKRTFDGFCSERCREERST